MGDGDWESRAQHPIDEKQDGFHVYYPEHRVFKTVEEARAYIDRIGRQPYPTNPAWDAAEGT